MTMEFRLLKGTGLKFGYMRTMNEETVNDVTIQSIKSELQRLRKKLLRKKEWQLDPGRPLSIRATLQSKQSIKRILPDARYLIMTL